MLPSDSDLIERCLNGEQPAWTQLIARYERLIYSVARKICARPEDSADVFQSVCMDLYRSLNTLRSDRTLPAWLITVTRRRAYTFINRQTDDSPLEEDVAETQAAIERVEREYLVEQSMLQLPSRCQELLHLLYFDLQEPSYEQISVKTGIPVPSIGPTRARCLEKLRRLIER